MSRWSPPRLRTRVEPGERHATWLELFFGLVFVVAVAELAYLLHNDLTPRGLLVFAALFVPVWWQWIDFSYYGDQYDTDDLSYRLALLAAMLGVVLLALTIPDVPDGGSTTGGADRLSRSRSRRASPARGVSCAPVPDHQEVRRWRLPTA